MFLRKASITDRSQDKTQHTSFSTIQWKICVHLFEHFLSMILKEPNLRIKVCLLLFLFCFQA